LTILLNTFDFSNRSYANAIAAYAH